MDERRRPSARAVGHAAAVGNHVITQFAIGRFNGRIYFLNRRMPLPIAHNQLEMMNQPFDAAINRQLIGHGHFAISIDVDWTGRQILDGLVNNFTAFEHLFHADEIARITIALTGTHDLEIEIAVGQVWLIFAQVADDAASASDRSRTAQIDSVFFR